MAAIFGRKSVMGTSLMPGEDDWLRKIRENDGLQALRPQGDINGGLIPALAPNGPPSGLLGSGSRLDAPRLTNEPNEIGAKDMASGDPSPFRPMLPDFDQGSMRNQLPDITNAPRTQSVQPDSRLLSMIGDAPRKRNNTGRDIMAGALAAISDAFSPDRKGPGAVDMLAKQWGDRRDTYKQDLQNYETRKRMASMPDMTERELQAFMLDPKAWAGSMARDATSKFGASTLNPGDIRHFGKDSGTYQAPTRAEQYAQNLRLQPGTEAYDNAVRDQELGANGPTAFGNQQTLQEARNAQAAAMERLRQQGRMTMQGARVAGQQTVRGTPTYRDLNPPPPRSSPRSAPKVPTARGQNGETIFYKGGRWVDAQGKPVQ